METSIVVACPGCAKMLKVPQSACGQAAYCPHCNQAIRLSQDGVPSCLRERLAPPPPPAFRFCARCGTRHPAAAYACPGCGAPLQHPPAARPAPAPVDSGLETMIPYRNGAALASYYIGIFSLLPLIGIPMGIVATVLGRKGLAFAKAHPESRGVTHAWVGIIAGLTCAIGQIALAILFTVMGIMAN